MRRSLSANELALSRSRPQGARFYAAAHRPRVLFMAQLAASPDNFPGSEVRYTNISSGAMAAVSAGLTLRVGTAPGSSDLGIIRVSASAASPVLRLAEYGSALINWSQNNHLTVVEEFLPWPVHHSYDTALSKWRVDYDLYTSQLENYGPLALMGPPATSFLDAGTGKMIACYVGDFSQSLTPGVSITSQRWEFPNGNVVTSLLGTSQNPILITYTNASAGGQYVSLTVTDANGGSHVRRGLVFAFGSGADQPMQVGFDAITGGLRQGGYRTRLTIFGSSGGSEIIPDATQIVLFESASYGANKGISIGGNFPFRENIVMVGWVERESQRFDPFTRDVAFDLHTLDSYLGKTEAYDIFLQNANDGTAASDWDMAGSLTLNRAAIALTKYRSTIANIADVFFASAVASENQIEYQSLPRGSLWNQLQQNYRDKGMLGLPAADLQSSLYLTEDVQVTGGSAALPLVMTITQQDRANVVQVERDHRDQVSEQLVYGVTGVSPVGGVSPATPIGYFGGRQEVTRGLVVDDQQTVITWAGNVRAAANNPFKRMVVPLAGNLRLDSVPQARVQMSLSPTENSRRTSFSNEQFLPYETNIRYDARAGFALTELVMEKVVNGIGGSAITFPAQGGSWLGDFPLITLPEWDIPDFPVIVEIPGIENQGDGNTVYVMGGVNQINGGLARTTDFLSNSPTWVDVRGNLAGGSRVITYFAVDPSDPNNKACLVGAASVLADKEIWFTDNLSAASPTWTMRFSESTSSAKTGVANVEPADFTYCWGVPGLIFFRTTDRRCLHTHDRGDNWSVSAQIGVSGGTGPWLTLVEPNSGSRVWFESGQADGTHVFVSNDGGHTFVIGARSGNATIGNARFGFGCVPVQGNSSGNTVFLAGANGTIDSDAFLRKYTSGATANPDTNYVDVSPTSVHGYEDGGGQLVVSGSGGRFIVVNSRDSRYMGALLARASARGAESPHFFVSSDGGVSWALKKSFTAAVGGLQSWPYNTSWFYCLGDNGKILFSQDEGKTWKTRTGNYNSLFSPDVTQFGIIQPITVAP